MLISFTSLAPFPPDKQVSLQSSTAVSPYIAAGDKCSLPLTEPGANGVCKTISYRWIKSIRGAPVGFRAHAQIFQRGRGVSGARRYVDLPVTHKEMRSQSVHTGRHVEATDRATQSR